MTRFNLSFACVALILCAGFALSVGSVSAQGVSDADLNSPGASNSHSSFSDYKDKKDNYPLSVPAADIHRSRARRANGSPLHAHVAH